MIKQGRNDRGGSYDLAELDDQALFIYGAPSTYEDHQRQGSVSLEMRPPTLNIFPSQPMHVADPSSSTTKVTSGLVSSSSSDSRRPYSESSFDNIPLKDAPPPAPQCSKAIKSEGNKKGPMTGLDQGRPKTPDPKALRRLAQNREAARKSRLRKKAYVQQLESSRIKLNQLEQELQRARAQGVFLGGGGGDQGVAMGMSNISSGHIDDLMNLKSIVVKSYVFHIISGTWKTPAERCFMWIGGFRPSELIKIVLGQIEPLRDQQLMAICEVQQATQEAEDALSQGLDALNQSLYNTIASDALSSPNYMGQMVAAMNKLSTLESFVIQQSLVREPTPTDC
ncbi:hypothetical protein L1987_13830 [Smallanthus sonchifolius]|uniref:Uncharacterized protein n=1 Tax=Smallanthus sonchifolius TaxID=185202 RepID=A0ACB9JI55_9ASTR|nr:hypothetical protein L1987_13830 [Smallanthus sonchifolius]